MGKIKETSNGPKKKFCGWGLSGNCIISLEIGVVFVVFLLRVSGCPSGSVKIRQ